MEDLRKDYGEQRFQALGRIGERLHMLVFTIRDETIHVINTREVTRYEAS
ncbi:BrnT family toxin [Pigmentiphaga humi]|nr:BrnT family toxin [Pigmentiphaga humi]